jgi:hypothetical protein
MGICTCKGQSCDYDQIVSDSFLSMFEINDIKYN